MDHKKDPLNGHDILVMISKSLNITEHNIVKDGPREMECGRVPKCYSERDQKCWMMG